MAVTMVAGNQTNEYFGLSTDVKDTDDETPNASTFYEMDTQDIYCFDKEHGVWLKQ